MSKEIPTRKEFLKYIVAVFVLAYPIQIFASYKALQGKALVFTLITALVMFVPMISVLIAKHNLKNLGWSLRIAKKYKYYLIAWFSPVVFSILGACLFYMIFPYTFDLSGKFFIAKGGQETLTILSDPKNSVILLVIIAIIQSALLAPVFNILFAIGEEVGWRGYMYPYLKTKFGVVKGRIIGGTIWGIWHWPLIIIAGYEYGINYFGAPFLGPVLFTVIAVILGIILDYLYVNSGSIVVPSIFHAGVNAVASLPILVFDIEYEKYSILGSAFIGAVSMIPMLVFAVWISYKDRKTQKSDFLSE